MSATMTATAPARRRPHPRRTAHGPASRPRLRRIPTPATEPPYDLDPTSAERDARLPAQPAGPAGAAVQGTLALELVEPAYRAGPVRHLTVVADPPATEDEPAPAQEAEPAKDDPYFARQPTPSMVLPDPRSWSGRFVQAIVEVLTGRRAAAQLLRWTDEAVYADLQVRARAARRVRSGSRPVVRSVHVCEPQDGVAEAAVHVRHDGRSRAVAVRLEGMDGRWRCTALQLG